MNETNMHFPKGTIPTMGLQDLRNFISKVAFPVQAGAIFLAVLVISAIFALFLAVKKASKSNKSKEERAIEMKQAFQLIEKHNETLGFSPSMKVGDSSFE